MTYIEFIGVGDPEEEDCLSDSGIIYQKLTYPEFRVALNIDDIESVIEITEMDDYQDCVRVNTRTGNYLVKCTYTKFMEKLDSIKQQEKMGL